MTIKEQRLIIIKSRVFWSLSIMRHCISLSLFLGISQVAMSHNQHLFQLGQLSHIITTRIEYQKIAIKLMLLYALDLNLSANFAYTPAGVFSNKF